MQNITNLDIKYKDFIDDNNSETIVILHWWWWKSDSWLEVGELLFKSWFNVIIPDLPWFWETKLDYAFDLDEYAKVITNFLRKLKIDNFILWWHSNWWAIAIKIANSNIFSIKTLVLNNSAWIRKNKKRNIKKAIFSVLSKPFKFIFKLKSLSKLRKKIYSFIWWWDYIKSEDIPFLKETYLNIIKDDISLEIKNVWLDTLLIRWELDNYTPLSDAYFMRNDIKKSKLIIISDEWHSIHLKNPKLLVNKFLENI